MGLGWSLEWELGWRSRGLRGLRGFGWRGFSDRGEAFGGLAGDESPGDGFEVAGEGLLKVERFAEAVVHCDVVFVSVGADAFGACGGADLCASFCGGF